MPSLAKRRTILSCKELFSGIKGSKFIIVNGCSSCSAQTVSKSIRKCWKDDYKFVVYCNSQISEHGRNGRIEESESVFRRMPNKTVVSYTAMLTAYAQNGQLMKAQKLFDEMPERSTASYNAMITAYVRSNCMVDEAYELFSQMGEGNVVSFAAMITGFLRAGMFDRAEELYADMPVEWRDPVCSNAMISGYLKVGRLEEAVQVFEQMKMRDIVSWSSMVDGYCKKGRIGEARAVFDGMLERNVVTWTAMINGYMNAGSFQDGFDLFLTMRKQGVVAVNSTTLTVILEACGRFGKFGEGVQLHGLALQSGFEFDVFLDNSIINMYCRCGCVDEANRVFQMMRKRDSVSWNSLISGYIQHGEVQAAYNLFENMPAKDVVSWTAIIAGFSSKGNMEDAVQLFKIMPEKDDVAWTAVISGFVNNGEYEKAFFLFTEMLQKAVRPNSHTLSSMLHASAGLATLNEGLQIHAYTVKMEIEFDLSIQNSLVAMYSKCGNIAEAYQIFTNIDVPNIISLNSMITGFSQNGCGEEALKLFSTMQNDNMKPNEVTFLGVLSACAHVGLVEEGRKYFALMKSVYLLEPGPDHYACMVDLLGRVGLLDEAINLIRSMPVGAHSGVWGALLGASRTHFRLDLAKLAAEHLTRLEPDSAIPYVVLSELCNIAGKSEEGKNVTMMKRSKRIRKNPGCSWIAVEGNVDSFLAIPHGPLRLHCS